MLRIHVGLRVRNSQNPVQDCTGVQSLKFGEDCKIVTLPKQLLYITRDITCDHVIYKPSRTLIHGKFTEKWGLRIVKFKKIVSFLLRFQEGCTRL